MGGSWQKRRVVELHIVWRQETRPFWEMNYEMSVKSKCDQNGNANQSEPNVKVPLRQCFVTHDCGGGWILIAVAVAVAIAVIIAVVSVTAAVAVVETALASAALGGRGVGGFLGWGRG